MARLIISQNAARKKRRAARKPVALPPTKPVCVYSQVIDAISLIEVVRRSIDPEAQELVVLKCAVKSLWLAHDRLDELGIKASVGEDDE